MRTTKYQKADKIVNVCKKTVKAFTSNQGNEDSKAFWIETLIRKAYLKGYKAGMARQRRIVEYNNGCQVRRKTGE